MPEKKRKRYRRKEQPHDAVFKVFFGDAKIAKSYLLNYIPDELHKKIDFAVFEKSDTAYVNGRFGLSFSDMVYNTQLIGGGFARILFLFEHKSYLPTLPIFLQLLDYFLQIWEDDIKNARPLSFIIPIVVYHGKRRWEKKPFSEYFPGLPEVFQRFIPNFDFVLTDLSLIPPQVIKVHGRRPLFLCWGMRDAEEEGISNVQQGITK